MKRLYIHAALIAALTGALLCMSGCEDDDDGPQQRTLNFFDDEHYAGTFVIPWATNFPSGKLVPPDTYTFRMISGTYRSSVDVHVVKGAPDVISGCDSAYQAGGSLPDAYDLRTNATTFAPGDTVCITYSLPAAGRVRMDILYWE